MLKIADNLSLPLDAVTQTFGILSVRGAGKTNCAAVMAEQMYQHKLPFVVVDPVGSWYGLRSSADGKEAGLSIPIFGSRHGDVPLEKLSGVMIADLVVDERLSCVLDCSEFSEGDKNRFLIDFGERLYRRNQDPLHLYLEEADDFIPQRPFREQARLLRVWENIVRRGRARGLGITMITQRSAAINKNVLTQIETLITLRTTAPNDRKAIEAWVEYHGQNKAMMESLPGLEDGEAWVWSPSWLRILKRVKIHRRQTFDSGATPKDVKGARPVATLADVDLGKIQKQMAATIERAKAEDPKELRRQIADLKRQLSAKTTERIDIERVEIPVLRDSQIQKLAIVLDKASREIERHAIKVGDFYAQYAESTKDITGAMRLVVEGHKTPLRGSSVPAERRLVKPKVVGSMPTRAASLNGDEKLGKCEEKILATLAQHGECDIKRLGVLSGYRRSGGFKNAIGKLRALGYLDGLNTGVMAITEAGLKTGEFEALPTGRDLFNYWMNNPRMGPCEREIMKVLDGRKHGLTIEDIAEASDYQISGGFKNSLGKLRTAGVIVGRNTERMRLSDDLL